MKQNVFEHLDSGRPSLVKRLGENGDVVKTVMAYLGLLWSVSRLHRKPVAGVRIGELHGCDGDVFRAPVHFTTPLIGTAMNPYGKGSDFFEFTKAKAMAMAGVLYLNPTLEKFFERMVETISQWAAHKRCAFSEVTIEEPILTKDLSTLQFRLVKGVKHGGISQGDEQREAELMEEARKRMGLVRAVA